MNTLELSQRLGRNLRVEDSTDLPAAAALDVLSAINAGVSCFYKYLASAYRQTTLSVVLRAPEMITGVTFAARYSRNLSGDTFEDRQRGCTVRFNTGADNEITGRNTVLDDWLEDTLTVDATVYHDAVGLEYVIKRIIGDVRIYLGNGRRAVRVLMRDERLRRGYWNVSPYGPGEAGIWDIYGFTNASTIGCPRYYYIDPVGASQGGDPQFYLRVLPLPDIDYTVRFEAELGPRKITFGELKQAVRVPVAEDYAEDMLVPLCEAQLTRSRFWADADSKKDVLAKAEEVKTRELAMVAPEVGMRWNQVGTPAGF